MGPVGLEPTTADKGRSIAATMGLPDPMGAGREAGAPSVLSPGAGLVEIAVELVGPIPRGTFAFGDWRRDSRTPSIGSEGSGRGA
jgi:hypothetical protein